MALKRGNKEKAIKETKQKSVRVLEGNTNTEFQIRGKRIFHETEKPVGINLSHVLGVKILCQSISTTTTHLWYICFISMLPCAMTQNTLSIMLTPGIHQAHLLWTFQASDRCLRAKHSMTLVYNLASWSVSITGQNSKSNKLPSPYS